MKRFLTIAAVCAGLILFSNATNATAGDNTHGGQGAHQSGHAVQHGGQHSYGHRWVGSYQQPSYGYGSQHGVIQTHQGYRPSYHGGYVPSHRSYGHGGGLHLGFRGLRVGFGGHH